jgi:hypothetical protein
MKEVDAENFPVLGVEALEGMDVVEALEGMDVVEALEGVDVADALEGVDVVVALEGVDVVETLEGRDVVEAEIGFPSNLDPSLNSEDNACKQRLANQLYWPTNPQASKEWAMVVHNEQV